MKIGEFDVMIVSPVNRDELVAEIQKDNHGLGTLCIEDGKPIINIGPNRKDEHGVWTIDYHTFKQIIKVLDEFLVSIGYPAETEEKEGA